jgi:hypothetical protein
MSKITKRDLSALYKGADINVVWRESRHLAVIDHPQFGKISPTEFRAKYVSKPCPFCGKKMTHGSAAYTTQQKEAIARGYQYKDKNGSNFINRAGDSHSGFTYFHPHYVTLDHKLNKARCPEKMFDADNLQAMCWKCNSEKGDNNAYELQHSLEYIQDLTDAAIERYPVL